MPLPCELPPSKVPPGIERKLFLIACTCHDVGNVMYFSIWPPSSRYFFVLYEVTVMLLMLRSSVFTVYI